MVFKLSLLRCYCEKSLIHHLPVVGAHGQRGHLTRVRHAARRGGPRGRCLKGARVLEDDVQEGILMASISNGDCGKGTIQRKQPEKGFPGRHGVPTVTGDNKKGCCRESVHARGRVGVHVLTTCFSVTFCCGLHHRRPTRASSVQGAHRAGAKAHDYGVHSCQWDPRVASRPTSMSNETAVSKNEI